MRKTLNKAYSLIELSLVILIIGILIAAVIQGSKLYKGTQLAIAQNITRNSPVNNIPNLQVWWETSNEKSFNTNESDDGSTISAWYDNNPQSLFKTTATQSTSTNKPIYVSNAFSNGIPGIRFTRKCPSGTYSPTTSSYMNFDGSSYLPLSDLTIFTVSQKTSSCNGFLSLNPILSGVTPSNPFNVNIFLGWRSDTQPNYFIYSGTDARNSGTASLAYNGRAVPLIFTAQYFRYATSNLRVNGALSATGAASGLLTAFVGGKIGAYGTSSVDTTFNGDIAEIIIFTRALTTEEIKAVESYLGQKYNIALS